MRLSDLPRFLLFAESAWKPAAVGRWRFRVESMLGDRSFEATGDEDRANRDRLDLLAVVRGLESLDQPTHVTLVTGSRYVGRGLRFGLGAWRQNDWCWESDGGRTAVRDADLWRRVDGAMQYHQVDCRVWAWAPDSPQLKPTAPPRRDVKNRWWQELLRAAIGLNRRPRHSSGLAAIPS